MRTSPVHYIAPSAISMTPNANGSANDIAVHVSQGTKIKVYCDKLQQLDIDPATNSYREWTLAGRNRRLNDPSGTKKFTIYARLAKNDSSNGYLVFSPMSQYTEGERVGEWYEAHSHVTVDGLSVRYDDGSWSETVDDPAYWYVRIGEVSLPENEKRSLTLDTGILGTVQYNEDWHITSDHLPMRVVLGSKIDGEDAGTTPYVPWGKSLALKAGLVLGWEEDANSRVQYWTITRNTGNAAADDAWNYPSDSSDSSSDEDTTGARRMDNGQITLSHARGDGDDFCAAVSAVFTITAWGLTDDSDSSSDEQEPGELASATITVHAETVETYGLEKSVDAVSYDPQTRAYSPADGVGIRVRAKAQDGTVFYLTQSQIQTASLHVYYLPAGQEESDSSDSSSEEETPDELTFTGGRAMLPVAAFAAGKSITLWLENGEQTVLDRTTVAYVRFGEKGQAGDAGTLYQRMYKSTASSSFGPWNSAAQPAAYTDNSNGWRIAPTAISSDARYRWITERTSNDGGTTWTAWTTPVYDAYLSEDGRSINIKGAAVAVIAWGQSLPATADNGDRYLMNNEDVADMSIWDNGTWDDETAQMNDGYMVDGHLWIKVRGSAASALPRWSDVGQVKGDKGDKGDANFLCAVGITSMVVETDREGHAKDDYEVYVPLAAHYGLQDVLSQCTVTFSSDSSVSLSRVGNSIRVAVSDGSSCPAQVTVSITFSHPTYGSQPFSFYVTRVEEGSAGSTGKRCYIAGEYSDSIVYTSNDSETVAVEVPVAGSTDADIYVLSAATNVVSGVHIPPTGNSQSATVWEQGQNRYNLLKTKYLFAAFANLGSFVVEGDYFLSQYGTLVASNGALTPVNASNVSTLFGGKVPYMWFDAADPMAAVNPSLGNYKFRPAKVLNALTGEEWMAAGKVHVSASGDVTMNGVMATDGSFSGTVKASNFYKTLAIASSQGASESQPKTSVLTDNGQPVVWLFFLKVVTVNGVVFPQYSYHTSDEVEAANDIDVYGDALDWQDDAYYHGGTAEYGNCIVCIGAADEVVVTYSDIQVDYVSVVLPRCQDFPGKMVTVRNDMGAIVQHPFYAHVTQCDGESAIAAVYLTMNGYDIASGNSVSYKDVPPGKTAVFYSTGTRWELLSIA